MLLLYDMGQSLAHLLLQAIFSTKDRRPFLIREIFKRYRVPSRNALFGIEAPRGSDALSGRVALYHFTQG